MNTEVEIEGGKVVVTMYNQTPHNNDPRKNGSPNERGGKRLAHSRH